jgi:hypothetical protein
MTTAAVLGTADAARDAELVLTVLADADATAETGEEVEFAACDVAAGDRRCRRLGARARAADRAGVDTRVARAVREAFERGVELGQGDEDMAAVYSPHAARDPRIP